MCCERARCRPSQIGLLAKAHRKISFDEEVGIPPDLPTALDERREAVSVRANIESRTQANGVMFLEAIDDSRMDGERDILPRRIVDRGHELEVERERAAVSDRDADGKTNDEIFRDRRGLSVASGHDGKRDANVPADTRRRFLRAGRQRHNQRNETHCQT